MIQFDILIPAYNAEKTISKTIESVLGQSYPLWQLIIVNDGSMDCTARMCEGFLKKDDRIRFINRRENMGVVYTRKQLMENVSSDYFMFVDADDILHPDALRLFSKVISESQERLDIVYTKSIQNFSRRLHIGLSFKRDVLLNIRTRKCPGADCLGNFLSYPYFHIALTSKAYHRRLAAVSMSDIPSLFVGEDICMNLKMFCMSKHVCEIDKRIYYYRPGGGSSGYSTRLAGDIAKLYFFRDTFITKNHLPEKYRHMNLHNAIGTFYVLCSGCTVDGDACCSMLKPVFDDAEKKQIKDSNIDKIQEWLGKESVYIPTSRDSLLIEIKKWVVNHL